MTNCIFVLAKCDDNSLWLLSAQAQVLGPLGLRKSEVTNANSLVNRASVFLRLWIVLPFEVKCASRMGYLDTNLNQQKRKSTPRDMIVPNPSCMNFVH